MPVRIVSGLLGTTWRSIARLQWQPTLSSHDPNPPITINTGSQSFTLVVDPGSFVWTGIVASLLYKRLIAATGGVYVWTGTAATLFRAITLVAAAGSYSEVGTAASLLYNRLVAANTVAYALTGSAASLLRAAILVAVAGSYSETGSAASLLYGRLISGETVLFVWTGANVTFNYNQGGGVSGYSTSPLLGASGAIRVGALGKGQ